jgi:hypothetical protein
MVKTISKTTLEYWALIAEIAAVRYKKKAERFHVRPLFSKSTASAETRWRVYGSTR